MASKNTDSAMNEEVSWIVAVVEGREAAWKRTLLIHPETKEVYIPAAASPDGEAMTFMGACWSGVAYVLHLRHVFLPLEWMVREYPDWAEVYEAMQGTAERALVQL